MAVLFFDSFSGDELISAHTPEVAFAGYPWAVEQGTPRVTGGVLTSPTSTPEILAISVGGPLGTYSLNPATSFRVETEFVLPSNVPVDGSLRLTFMVAGSTIIVYIEPAAIGFQTSAGYTSYPRSWSFPGSVVVIAVEVSGTSATLYENGSPVATKSFTRYTARELHYVNLTHTGYDWGGPDLAKYLFVGDIGTATPPDTAPQLNGCELVAPSPGISVLGTVGAAPNGGSVIQFVETFEGSGLVDYRPLSYALKNAPVWFADNLIVQNGAMRIETPSGDMFASSTASLQLISLKGEVWPDDVNIDTVFIKFKVYGGGVGGYSMPLAFVTAATSNTWATGGIYNDGGEVGIFAEGDVTELAFPWTEFQTTATYGLRIRFNPTAVETSLLEYGLSPLGFFEIGPEQLTVYAPCTYNLAEPLTNLHIGISGAGVIELSDVYAFGRRVPTATPKVVLYDAFQPSEYNGYSDSFDARILPITPGGTWVHTVGTAAITGGVLGGNAAENTSNTPNDIGELTFGSTILDVGLPGEYVATFHCYNKNAFPSGSANYFGGVLFQSPELTVEVKLVASAFGVWSLVLTTTSLNGVISDPAPVAVVHQLETNLVSLYFKLSVASGAIVASYEIVDSAGSYQLFGDLTSLTTYTSNVGDAGLRKVSLRLGPQVGTDEIIVTGTRLEGTYNNFARLSVFSAVAFEASGSIFTEIGTSELTAPVPVLEFNGHAVVGSLSALLSPVSAQLFMRGHGARYDRFAALISPAPSLFFSCGGYARLTPPAVILQTQGTVTGTGRAALSPSAPLLTSKGTTGGMSAMQLTAPLAKLVGYSGAVCSVSIGGRAECVIRGTTGGVATLAVKCPLFELSASGTAQNHGGAELLAPSPELGRTLQAWLVAPRAKLVAIGTAVVEATYEAYAMNMLAPPNLSPNEQRSPEVTRYTNFPFTHVVRYKNSYYGANSAGLFLLEGSDDDGSSTPFEVKTCETDFATKNLKTVESIYFSGRIGGAKTVTLYSRETDAFAMSFTTPRSTVPQSHRQVFPRGVKARYFAFGISGADVFELDTLDISVGKTKRSI